MKGAIAAALYALWIIHEENIEPGNIKLQSVIGEEAGEAGTRDALERGQLVILQFVWTPPKWQYKVKVVLLQAGSPCAANKFSMMQSAVK